MFKNINQLIFLIKKKSSVIKIMKQKIETKRAPQPGNYSQGIKVDLGNYVVLYTSGQTGNIPHVQDEPVAEGGIGMQTARALENVRGIVEAAGGSLEHVVKVTVFMENMERDKSGFEAVYRRFFSDTTPPARSLVEVKRVPLASEDTIVEIEAIAYIPKSKPNL